MKNVLVTGADGFIGSHLTEALLAKGHKVKALSQYNSFNYWGWLEDIPANQNLEVVSGDIRDPHFCKEITKDVDLIFHLAALIAIPYSYVAPDAYLETNVKGTLNICQAAKENGNIRVIHTSTSEVYGTAQYVPIDEKHPKQPQSPYSDSTIGKEINIASNFEISMKDTLDLVKKIMKSDVQFITDEQRLRPEKSEVFRLWGDNSLIKELTGFSPDYDIEKGLTETCEWFSLPENLKKYKATIYNV